MEIEMAYMNGIEIAKTLLAEGIPTRFVFLTLAKSKEFLNRALEVGIKGYLLKESSENEILECIRFVHEGKAYVNASMSSHLAGTKSDTDADPFSSLSSHEINILKLIARQKSSHEIADMLFISPKTVANHRTNISKKLDLNGEQNGLLKWAIEHKELLG